MLRYLLLLATCCMSLVTFAQEAASLDGDWKARFESLRGAALEADVKIGEAAGTWRTLASNRFDKCIGREFPLVISNLGAEGFDLAIYRSKALTGCQDSVYKMHRVNDKTYESQFEDGRKFQLVRQ